MSACSCTASCRICRNLSRAAARGLREMATCPRCFGALTEHHRCPRRSILSAVMEAISTVGIGGFLGGLLAILVNDQAPTALVLAAAALGAVVASAVRQAVGRRP